MDDGASYEDKGMGNAILTFPSWQEGLFAVMYVMNNDESVKQYGPVNAASDATFEIISIFLELIQTLPFLLPTYKIYPCDQDSTMGAGCILKTIGQFWLPAQGTDFETFFGIMLALSVVTYAMGAVAFYAASTFHKKDVHFVWPIVFIRWTVRLLITTYFIAVLQSQMLVFSCSLLKDGYVTSGLECGSPKHTLLMVFVAISLVITVPFGIVFGLLYNTQDVTAKDPGSSAHGRSRLIGYITRIIVPAAYVVSKSVRLDGENTAAAFVSQGIAAIALAVYAVSRVVCVPQIVNWANSARTALSFVFLAICLTGFSSDIDGMTVGLIGLVGACVGLVVSNWRKAKTIQWARHRFYTVKPKLSDAYAAFLVESLFEECQNIKPPGQAYLDDEPAEAGATIAEDGGAQPTFNVKDKAAVTMVRNLMWIETDIELLFRFFLEEWEAMSAEDRKAAKVVINEIFVQVFHTGMFREFALMWYAVISRELFQDYLTSKHFLRVAFESNKSLDMRYLAYQLQKQNETARQAANLGGNNATGNRFNLVDLVTFKRFAETAKKNHRKALTCIQHVFSRMIHTDIQMAQTNPNDIRDDDDEEEQEESRGLKVSASELQQHNALLQEAMWSVRQAEASYAALTKAFPKSSEARALYLQFMKQVLPEEAPTDMLSHNDNDEAIEKSDSSSSVGGLKSAMSPKQEYVRDLRSKLASIIRFTTITMWLGLLLMGTMMLIIAGVGHNQEKYLVERTVENVDALNAIRTSWLGICKFSVEISHFVRVRDDDRKRLSIELPPKNSQLVTLLNSVQNMNIGAAPVTAGTSDLVADVIKSNTDHEKMSDGDLNGLQSDWSDQVQILRKELKAGKTVNLLDTNDALVKSNQIPRVVTMATSPTSQVLRKFHEKYRADKAAGKSEWSCKMCNMHDIYVTDARGILVGFDLESGNKMQVNTDYEVFNKVKTLEIGKNLGKVAEDFDSDPVLWERYKSWNIQALLRLYQANRPHYKFFEAVKRTDPVLKQVHVEQVQHSDQVDQQYITITVPIWSPQPPADPTKDKPIGYVTSEARVLTSDFLEEVLKIQDLVWDLVMEMLTTLAKDISRLVDQEIKKAAEQGDNLKMHAFTDEVINLTYYSGVTQADSGNPEDAKLRTDKAWGRTYQTVSFQTVVAEFSNAVVTTTANLQTMTYDELTKLPNYRFITEMCVRPPQSYSLEMTNLTTDFPKEFIAGRVGVLVGITCAVILVNLLTCFAMNCAISQRLADFEERDERGLTVAFKLVQDIPIMSKKRMCRQFKQHLKTGFANAVNSERQALARSSSRSSFLGRSLLRKPSSPNPISPYDGSTLLGRQSSASPIAPSPAVGGMVPVQNAEPYSDGDGPVMQLRPNLPPADMDEARNHSRSGSGSLPSENAEGHGDTWEAGAATDWKEEDDALSDSDERSPRDSLSDEAKQHLKPNKLKAVKPVSDADGHAQNVKEQAKKLDLKRLQSADQKPRGRDAAPARETPEHQPALSASQRKVFISDVETSRKGSAEALTSKSSPGIRREPSQGRLNTGSSMKLGGMMENGSQRMVLQKSNSKLGGQWPDVPKGGNQNMYAIQKRPSFNNAMVQQPPQSPRHQEKAAPKTIGERVHGLFLGWTRGYLRRWIVILWAGMIVYTAGLLARVLLNFYDFGIFCEDLALAQKTHFYFRNACTRVMDTVTYERMPWRTDTGQKLREDFDESLGLAEESLNTLIGNKDAAKYEPRQQLLFHPTCMLGSGNCGSRTGWEAYKNPELMERGMYRAALVWLDHVKELRREYADTKLPQSYINSTHPPEFWFVRDSIAYDLAPGLYLLIQTYIDQAEEYLPVTSALVWAVAGGGLACVGLVSFVCATLMNWQGKQIANALTALRLLPWEDVQNQSVLTTAKIIADKDGPADAASSHNDFDM